MYLSTAMIKHHDQGNFKKLIWGSQFHQVVESLTMMLGSTVAGRHDPQQKLRHEAEGEIETEIETERHTDTRALTRNDTDF